MKCLFITVFALLLPWCAVCASNNTGSFEFVQIADPQIGFSTNNVDLTPDIQNFEKAVEYINRTKPAFVIISGDMVNIPHDIKQIRAFWRIAKQIKADIPLHLVPGNHDMLDATKEDICSYNKLFGKDYYSFSYSGSEFIVLNTPVLCSADGDPQTRTAQLAWFEQQLKSAKSAGAKHIFALTHQPWFLFDPAEADLYRNVPYLQRKDYLSLMGKYGVDYSLAGHLHFDTLAQSGALSLITTSAISSPLGLGLVGFRVFKVYDDRVEHRFITMDQLTSNIGLPSNAK
ncbi:metallophosphoesterase [bacterium]|nr:metallophosphoesterase [bacterium]